LAETILEEKHNTSKLLTVLFEVVSMDVSSLAG